MEQTEVVPGIYWVGGIDWDLRNFHGYQTQRGSTYNAYLIVDEKTVLVDTVKHYLADEMIARISAVVDPADIDIIVSNHVEMDHSGSLPRLLEINPDVTVVTSVMGEKGLRQHYMEDWNFKAVKSGEELSIGERTLTFVHIPMVHWPDSMVTYIAEEKLLLPNDAFGQHIASPERFDDEIGWDIVREEAAKYYANIVLPYGQQVKKALDALVSLEIEMIAPSHGLILRSYVGKMIEEYKNWSDHATVPRAVIVYDSMWGSTTKMAQALEEGLKEAGIPVVMRNLKWIHISDILTDVIDSRLILMGSPTLNNGMLPTMGAFLTYLKGLRPRKRVGFAFGSYGWGGQAVGEIEAVMETLKWELPEDGIKYRYIPDEDALEALKGTAKRLAAALDD